ncbi:MAG: hypothetical protein Q8L88_07525 [Bacteroidota bacterium]|nr:hypothetical protein [Bacteroidota bacterium]
MIYRSLSTLTIFSLFWIVGNTSASAQTLPKNLHNHEISLDTAKKYIQNLKKDAMQMKTQGGMFYREVFDKMLLQKGVVALRFYYAKMDDGTPTLVAVGVDSLGKDMTTGTLAEKIAPCPPYCDQSSALQK